jgi:hypothetical protein
VKESYRKINKARKVKDEAFRIKFEAERERERQIHQQMKAAQLRRSIMRSGEIPDQSIRISDMGDLVRYVADRTLTDDHRDDGISAVMDLSWSPISLDA